MLNSMSETVFILSTIFFCAGLMPRPSRLQKGMNFSNRWSGSGLMSCSNFGQKFQCAQFVVISLKNAKACCPFISMILDQFIWPLLWWNNSTNPLQGLPPFILSFSMGERHSIAVYVLACRSRGPRIESRKGGI